MDKAITMPDNCHLDIASTIVALANVYQFGAKNIIRHSRVESRMFLWCKHGRGWVSVNGIRQELMAGHFLFMPWGHEVLYEPDARTPFFVGGIHLIPYQRRGSRMEWDVAHQPNDPLAGSKLRKDISWPGLEGLVRGQLEEDRLAWLTAYIVDCFHVGEPDEPTMRFLGGMLVGEICRATAGNTSSRPVPAALRRMQEYVRTNLSENLTVRDLAAAGQSSVAGVHRLFARFAGMTPHQFTAGVRLKEARRLLRTTQHPVAWVGRTVGFHDPFHFSRFFKRQTGLAPRVYRQRASIL